MRVYSVFFGAVGSGKSSVLEAIGFVYTVMERLNKTDKRSYNMFESKIR
jgi:exonuclease SbcC